MIEHSDTFSLRSQRAIVWWGIGFAIAYFVALAFLLKQMPFKDPRWSAQQVADWYVDHQLGTLWGAAICGFSGGFLVPICTVVSVQMARVEISRPKIWSLLTLVSGALFSVPLMLPPIFCGVAAYTAPREQPEVTRLMHELAMLTWSTTDQFY